MSRQVSQRVGPPPKAEPTDACIRQLLQQLFSVTLMPELDNLRTLADFEETCLA